MSPRLLMTTAGLHLNRRHLRAWMVVVERTLMALYAILMVNMVAVAQNMDTVV